MKTATGKRSLLTKQNQAVSISFLKDVTGMGLCKGPGI